MKLPLFSTENVAKIRSESSERSTAYKYADLKADIPKELTYSDNWEVTASHSEAVRLGGTAEPKGVFSHEGWSSGIPQTEDMWFKIELPEKKGIGRNPFQFTQYQTRYPDKKTSTASYCSTKPGN